MVNAHMCVSRVGCCVGGAHTEMRVRVWWGVRRSARCTGGGGRAGAASGPRFCMNVYFKVTRAVFRKLPNINSILGKFLYYIRKVTTATYKLLSIVEIEGDMYL